MAGQVHPAVGKLRELVLVIEADRGGAGLEQARPLDIEADPATEDTAAAPAPAPPPPPPRGLLGGLLGLP